MILTRKVKEIMKENPPKSEWGYTPKELEVLIEEVLKQDFSFNRLRYENTFIGNTCMIVEGEIVTYHCDVENALMAGIDNDYVEWID